MKPTTKLLIYAHFFAPSVGGVETSVLSLASGLAEISTKLPERFFEVTVVTQTPSGQFNDESLTFRVVRQPRRIALLRLIWEADLIHLAGPSLLPLFLAFVLRKPTVLEHHGYQSTCPNGHLIHQPERSICPGHFLDGNYLECLRCESRMMPLWKALLHILLMFPRYSLSRSASVNISISNYVQHRQQLPRGQTIYYGIEDHLTIDGLAPRLASEKLCFAYLGRFSPEKGIPIFLQAIRLLSLEKLKFEVKLIGDGPQRSEIHEMIEAMKLQDMVTLPGFVTGPALLALMETVSVVVMPSVCEETAGLAAIEQMMNGRLVIASRVGGLEEVVGDAGLLSPVGDAGALATCMRKVIEDPTLIDTLGKRARSRAVKLFQRSRMVADHAHLYSRMVQ